jgi:hypothetical protein
MIQLRLKTKKGSSGWHESTVRGIIKNENIRVNCVWKDFDEVDNFFLPSCILLVWRNFV